MNEPSHGQRRVVVLAAARPQRTDRLVARAGLRERDPLILDQKDIEKLHARMRSLGPIDVILDARAADPDRQFRRWRRLCFHLRHNGTWIAAVGTGPDLEASLGVRVRELLAATSRTRLARPRQEAARSVASVDEDPYFVRIAKQGDHLLKVRDAESCEVINVREPAMTVTDLHQVAGARVEPACPMVIHRNPGVSDDPSTAAQFDAPPLVMRHYSGRTALIEGVVARHGNTLLPDSYRWHLAEKPINKRLVDINPDWARYRREEAVGRHLEGDYYYFDYKHPGHYGHVMTEALSRVWGWHEAKATFPDLKLLLRHSPNQSRRGRTRRRPRPETVLMPAYGIAADDMVWVDESVTVDSLVGVTPMWHNQAPFSAHPAIRQVWDGIREGLPPATVPPAPKIFVTRNEGHRYCHNVADVQDFFSARGFTIVQPAKWSIPEQAALFGQARIVAGFGGTGMFNMAFAEKLERVIVLNHAAYDARNEQMMAALFDVEVHEFWGEPDIAHPKGGWSREAFRSDWTFDLDFHRVGLWDVT